jgi:hypothetical protein
MLASLSPGLSARLNILSLFGRECEGKLVPTGVLLRIVAYHAMDRNASCLAGVISRK